MGAIHHFALHVRDEPSLANQGPPGWTSMNHLVFALFALLLLGSLLSLLLLCLRRRRRARKQSPLPTYRPHSHHRSPSISHFDLPGKNESVFVYDEKMNLIHNSSSPPSAAVPEIHITFPDDDGPSASRQKNRVVVVHITDSGSVGMEPLPRDELPPYQHSDDGRFQSLDLERIGGLREKHTFAPQHS